MGMDNATAEAVREFCTLVELAEWLRDVADDIEAKNVGSVSEVGVLLRRGDGVHTINRGCTALSEAYSMAAAAAQVLLEAYMDGDDAGD